MNYSVDHLRKIAENLLGKRGVPSSNAQLQADLLIEAELRGLPSHGLQRLPRLLNRIDKKLANPTACGNTRWAQSAFLCVDGNRGLGPVVMMAALDELEGITRETGLAMAGINNANHIGMLAYYAEAATARGLIGIIMSTSEALVHPYGGSQAMLGTNPIAIGIPTATDPFILDLATSEVSMGKIHHHALIGKAIPEGWAVDAKGVPTTDAKAAMAGSIAPFGGAKGYGLGLAVELLVATLAGSNFAPEVRGTLDDSEPANKGDFILLINPGEQTGQSRLLTEYLRRLRESRPAASASPVAIPGEGTRHRRAAALKVGIEISGTLYSELAALAAA